MDEKEQENQQEITLPMDWHVSESVQGRYVNNVVVQPGKYEINVFFFESSDSAICGAA